VEPRATPDPGLRIVETRVYFDTASGEAVHIHRLAVGPDQDPDDDLRRGADTFDRWLRSQHDRELDFIHVAESDLVGAGPISVDTGSRTLIRQQ
jgi:hypothetical protein